MPGERPGGLGICEHSGKVMFSRKGARAVARKQRRKGENVEEFHHRECGAWHVGHRPDSFHRRSPKRRWGS